MQPLSETVYRKERIAYRFKPTSFLWSVLTWILLLTFVGTASNAIFTVKTE